MINANNLGILNSLTELINSHYDSNNHAIASYLVKNISHLDQITVNEIMDNAYVSRSAVRRFCEKLGYSSLENLKTSFSKIIFPSDIRHRTKEDYQTDNVKLTNLIKNMLDDINSVFGVTELNQIVDKIHNHNEVILLCANNTSSTLVKFQQEMIYANKIIVVLDHKYRTSKYLKSLKPNSLLFTVSTSGKYAEVINDLINELPGDKMIITGNRNKKLASSYNDVFYISQKSFSEDYLGIYGKYGITYLFDQIFLRYVNSYH